MNVKDLTNTELAIAVVKCLDGMQMPDGCHGCPLEDENGCIYDLKIEVAKRLMSCSEPENRN